MRKNRFFLLLCAQVFDLALVLLTLSAAAILFLPGFFTARLLLISLLVWVPLETLLLATIGTTLGKKLFGVKVRAPSFASACKHAIYLWDIKRRVTLVETSLAKRLSSAGLSALLIAALSAGYSLRDLWVSSDAEFFQEPIAESHEWYHHQDPAYSLVFPKKPAHIASEIPIPKSEEKLVLEEYLCGTDDAHYSLSFINFPKRWLRWGSTLVLKGCLKMIASQTGSKVIRTSKHKYQSCPSLEFEMAKTGGMASSGRLILKENCLYKVEVTYPQAQKSEVKEPLVRFIQSFSCHP